MRLRGFFRHENETKLGTLLIRFSLVFFAVFALLLSGGYLLQNHFIKTSYLQVRDLAFLTENLNLLEKALVEQENGRRGFILTGEESLLASYERGTADYERIIRILETNIPLTAGFSSDIESVLADAKLLQSAYDRPLPNLAEVGSSLGRADMQDGEQFFFELNTKFDDLSERISVQRTFERGRLLRLITLTLALTAAIALLALALYIYFIVKNIKRLVHPLTELDRAISSYEGSQTGISSYTSTGELGRLVNAFHRMGQDMRRESEKLEETYKMIDALNRADSVQDVYRETLLHMRQLVQCDKISLIMQNPDKRFSFKAVLQNERLNLKETLLPNERHELRELVQSGTSLLYEDWHRKRPPGELADRLHEEGFRSSVHVLLKKEARIVGILTLLSLEPGFFTAIKKQRLEKLAPMIVTAIENARQTDRIQSLAMRDGLTGLWNRRHFENVLGRLEQESCADAGRPRPLCLIMLDVDRFKQFNDTRGHQEGDAVLKHISLLLQAYCRFGDLPFRFGGEEFAVLLPDTQLEEAAAVADRLCRLIEFDSPSPEYVVTASFGVAQLQSGQPAQELIRSADSALYRAKALGRNRVCTDTQDLNDSA